MYLGEVFLKQPNCHFPGLENAFFSKIRGWAKSPRTYRTHIRGVRQGTHCFDAMETVLGIMTCQLEPEFNLAGTNRKEARTE